MKRKFLTGVLTAVLMLLFCLPQIAQAAMEEPENPELNLRQAMELAETNNPSLQRIFLEIRKWDIETAIARGSRMPHLDLSGSSTFSDYPAMVTSIREAGVFPPLDTHVTRLELVMTLPLYSGGKLQSAEALARNGLKASEENYRGRRQDLLFNVVTVYGKALHFRRLSEATSIRIQALEKEKSFLKQRFEQGRAAKLDLIRLQSHLSQARHEDLVLAQGEADSLSLLGAMTGSTKPVRSVRDIEYLRFPEIDSVSIPDGLPANNPDVLKNAALHAVAEAKAEMVRGDMMPQIGLFGKALASSGQNGDIYDDWQAGIQVSIPIWDASVRRNRFEQALLESEQARLLLEETRNQVLAEAREAAGNFLKALSRLETASQQTMESEEALRIEKLRYETGESSITDLLSAESALWVAVANSHQASYDLIVGRARIMRILGALESAHFGEEGQDKIEVEIREKDHKEIR